MSSRRVAVLGLLGALTSCSCDEKAAFDAGVVDAGPPVVVEREPNDGPDQAQGLDRSTIIEGTLGVDRDEDWFLLKSALPRTASLEVSCPPGADVALEVVDASRAVLLQVNGAGLGQPERMPNIDVPGKLLVRVVNLKKGVGGAYTMRVDYRERAPGFELEPNERNVDATLVPLGQAVSGYLTHGSDVDWYRYELPRPEGTDGGGEEAAAADDAGVLDAGEGDAGAFDGGRLVERRIALRVDVSGIEGVALDVQVLTLAEAVLMAAKSTPGAGISLRNLGVRERDSVIFVVVRSGAREGKDAGRGSSDETYYTLTVAPEDSQDASELEPNDEPSKATELPASSYVEGFITPKGDIDHYRLVTDGPVNVSLQLSGLENVDLVLSVLNPLKPEETLLKANEGISKEPEQLTNVYCDRECLVRVEAVSRKVDGKWVRPDVNGEQRYRLTTVVTPDDGSLEREPNNVVASGTPLQLGRPVRGTVFPKKDVDYYLLDLTQRPVKTPIRATVTGVLKVDVGLYLHRKSEEGGLSLVQTADTAKGDKPESLTATLEPGLYLFEVRDSKQREANFQDAYQLSVDEGGE